MRISVCKEDRDYVSNSADFQVTLDGVRQISCISADSDKGEIVRYRLNHCGVPVANRSGNPVVETVTGNVVITFVPRV